MARIIDKLQNHAPLTMPWAWYSGRDAFAATDAAFKPDGGRVVRTLLCADTSVPTLVRDILGYAATGGAGNGLIRHLPMKDPVYPWLWAQEISGVKQINVNAKLSGNTPVTDGALMTIVFAAPLYDIEADGKAEYDRFVIKTIKPCASYITLDQGSFEYEDGPNMGTRFNQGPAYLVQEGVIFWRWMYVPEAAIMTVDAIPTKFMDAIGKINSVAFAGQEAGTLLLESAEPIPSVAPVEGGGRGAVPRYFDVGIGMRFRNPPKAAGVTTSGWNLAPTRSGLWATIRSVDGHRRRYESTDFAEMFKCI